MNDENIEFLSAVKSSIRNNDNDLNTSFEYIDCLLTLGADVNIRDDADMGILDLIILGCGYHSSLHLERVLKLLDIVLIYKPVMRLNTTVLQSYHSELSFSATRANARIANLVGQCIISEFIRHSGI
jgi:hypothetical protein